MPFQSDIYSRLPLQTFYWKSFRAGYVSGDAFAGEVSVIDLRDKFVLPGLMDMHVHFTLAPERPDFIRTSDADYALMAAGNARTTLMAGITTVRDVGATSAEAIVAVRDAINDGTIPGPRMYVAAESVSAAAGHGDTRGLRSDVADLMKSEAMCDGADDCRRAVRGQYKLGADLIKDHATGGGADPNGKRFSAPKMFDDELAAVVATAHALGLKVTAHSHGTAGIKAALQDYFLSRSQIPSAIRDARRANIRIQRPKVREAIKRGVKFAMGTDSGVSPHGENAKEVAMYVELGMTPMESIEAATVNTADLMGKSNERGTLEKVNLRTSSRLT